MRRILLGGIVGGVVLFGWGFVAHMASPLWKDVVRGIPSEESVLGSMKGALKEPGIYFFPWVDMSRKLSEEEQKAWEAKMRAGPSGLLIYNPEGAEPMMAKQLGLEAASNIAAAILVAFVLSLLRGGFFARLLASGLFGAVAWASISFSYWNWYGFSWEFTRAELIDQVAGWLIAGIALAAIVRPKSRVSASQP